MLLQRNTKQGLSYRLVPLAPDDKPEWLLEGYGGKMPCLVHDEEVSKRESNACV